MERRDIGAVLEIWKHLMTEGSRADPRFAMGDPEAMRAYMTHWFEVFQPFRPGFIALIDGEIVGWISGHPAAISGAVSAPKTARIGDLWVHPEHRRKRIATELVRTWSILVNSAGYARIEVGTLANDERAVAFWKSQGFTDWRVTLLREA